MALVEKYRSASLKTSFFPRRTIFDVGGIERFDVASVTSQLEPEIPQLAQGVNVRRAWLCSFITTTTTSTMWLYLPVLYHHSATPLANVLWWYYVCANLSNCISPWHPHESVIFVPSLWPVCQLLAWVVPVSNCCQISIIISYTRAFVVITYWKMNLWLASKLM